MHAGLLRKWATQRKWATKYLTSVAYTTLSRIHLTANELTGLSNISICCCREGRSWERSTSSAVLLFFSQDIFNKLSITASWKTLMRSHHCAAVRFVGPAQGNRILGSFSGFPIRQVETLGTIPYFPDTSPRSLFHGRVALGPFRLSRVAIIQPFSLADWMSMLVWILVRFTSRTVHNSQAT